jgi:hypothetical protein
VQASRTPHQQQLGIGVGIQKLAACGQRDTGAVIATHAVNCQSDHEGKVRRPERQTETVTRQGVFKKRKSPCYQK